MTPTFVFFHGGPGLNSYCEKALLEPVFAAKGAKIHFWNEPSRLRPHLDTYRSDAPLQGYGASAEAFLLEASGADTPLHVISHSFSAGALRPLMHRHQQKIARITLIAPTFDFYETLKNILKAARDDFKKLDPEKEEAMNRLIAGTRFYLDKSLRSGLELALQDPNLLANYWAQSEPMQKFLSFFANPEAQIDVQAFFELAEDHARQTHELQVPSLIEVPTQVIFGNADRIITRKIEEEFLKKTYSATRNSIFENSAHYPHLEETDRFVAQCLSS